MRHRVTYIRDARSGDLNENSLKVSDNTAQVRGLRGAKEHRITIGLSELPSEITSVLTQYHELHIRWEASSEHSRPLPFVSRVAPGLHVFVTPLKNSDTSQLCSSLLKTFSQSLDCQSDKSFTSPPILSTRFSNASSWQLYSYLSSLAEFTQHLKNHICQPSDHRCQTAASSLETATSLDIDYDAISRVLIIVPVWERGPEARGSWSDSIVKTGTDDKVEVGVLNEERASDPEELSMGGLLVVIGDDKEPKPTLFSFPSRHHVTTSTFHATFDEPTGLHPTLRLTFPTKKRPTPPSASCALHVYLTLPSSLFLDRYAFADPLFLASHGLAALRALSGATDLEAPAWAVPQWGSAALLQLAAPPTPRAATVPLHARYLAPARGGRANATLPIPAVFWACAAESGARFAVNPFDRRELGFDGLFGERTAFHHLVPASGAGDGVVRVSVPVLDLARGGSGSVELGTIVAVAAGFAWACWALVRPVKGARKGKGRRGGRMKSGIVG